MGVLIYGEVMVVGDKTRKHVLIKTGDLNSDEDRLTVLMECDTAKEAEFPTIETQRAQAIERITNDIMNEKLSHDVEIEYLSMKAKKRSAFVFKEEPVHNHRVTFTMEPDRKTVSSVFATGSTPTLRLKN